MHTWPITANGFPGYAKAIFAVTKRAELQSDDRLSYVDVDCDTFMRALMARLGLVVLHFVFEAALRVGVRDGVAFVEAQCAMDAVTCLDFVTIAGANVERNRRWAYEHTLPGAIEGPLEIVLQPIFAGSDAVVVALPVDARNAEQCVTVRYTKRFE